MNLKKGCCFIWAGVGLLLFAGRPAECQVSPAPAGPSPSGQALIFCSAQSNEGKIMERIRQIEKNRIRYNEEARGQEYFEVIPGKIPILISAPHGAKHYRTRKKYWKDEQAYTASLAIALGQATGAHVIYTRNKTREDPNNDLNTRYKEAVRKAVNEYGIKFLIDLHGARRAQPFKIDVGILSKKTENSSCPTFKNIVERNFADYQEQIFNQKFTANDRCTITSFAWNDLKIEAIQVEINARLRKAAGRTASSSKSAGDPELGEEQTALLDLIGRIERVIGEVNEKIRRECPEQGRS
jgi:hypothetical protein